MKSKIIQMVFVLILVLVSCKQAETPITEAKEPSKLKMIKEQGTLRVVTDFNSTSYFVYRGQPMGYQYELLQELADYLEVKLEVIANNDLQAKFQMLENNEIDLIAVNLTVTKERKQFLDFTIPHTQTRQVLVQRKPENWRKLSKRALEEELIRNQLDLAGKEVYVQRRSTYARRLQNLSNEIGDSICTIEVDEGVEQLIELVARGDIEYTVCDENVAQVNQLYYDQLDIATPVSFPQNLAWAVDKNSDDLLGVVNIWLTEFKKTKKYAILYRKYFENNRSASIVESEYFANTSGTISPYDKVIKQYSEEIGWDWRLVASMMYQESRFNPKAKSWAGAFGLMQLMPATASRFGVSSSSTPHQQIRAGILFIDWLDKRLEDIKDEEERKKFILASYNVGLGHVIDARNLAVKHGKNPDIWEGNVDEFILNKAMPKYYNDPVVKYGYCRGTETYRYVSEIVERWEHYKNIVN